MKQVHIIVCIALVLAGCQTYQQKLDDQGMKKLSGAELQSMMGSNYNIGSVKNLSHFGWR